MRHLCLVVTVLCVAGCGKTGGARDDGGTPEDQGVPDMAPNVVHGTVAVLDPDDGGTSVPATGSVTVCRTSEDGSGAAPSCDTTQNGQFIVANPVDYSGIALWSFAGPDYFGTSVLIAESPAGGGFVSSATLLTNSFAHTLLGALIEPAGKGLVEVTLTGGGVGATVDSHGNGTVVYVTGVSADPSATAVGPSGRFYVSGVTPLVKFDFTINGGGSCSQQIGGPLGASPFAVDHIQGWVEANTLLSLDVSCQP